jgi:hypothetical protein
MATGWCGGELTCIASHTLQVLPWQEHEVTDPVLTLLLLLLLGVAV